MRLGVMSDSHGSYLYFKKALYLMGECDYILHCGDLMNHGPRNKLPEGYDTISMIDFLKKWEMKDRFIICKGNVDNDADQMTTGIYIGEEIRQLIFQDYKIYMVHGYKASLEEYEERAKSAGFDLLIYGHSHIKELARRKGLLVLNPGSIALPRDSSRSYAIIDDGYVSLYNLDEEKLIKREKIQEEI